MQPILIIFLLMISFQGISQSVLIQADSLQPKVKHVDPVFEDLTTALGARKGDKEADINFGYARFTIPV